MAPLGPFADLIAVGCSGGPDSLALTRLAHEWGGARVIALIVDHGLRAESAGEAAGVAAGLAEQGIQARVLTLGMPGGPGLQERARAARRSALLDACRQVGAPHLLLAHHLEDQAETVLFRALRGSAGDGLAGMAPVSVAEEALILRPLLGVPRARLAATLEGWTMRPVLDPSNADPRFARARLRAAGEVSAAARAAKAYTRRRARAAWQVAGRLAEAVRLLPEGCAEIDRERLGRDEAARRLMAALIRAVGGGEHAPSHAAVARLLARGEGSLGGACWLRGGRWLVREAGPTHAGAVWDGRFRPMGALAEGMEIGPLGSAAASFRSRARHLPAAALARLPAVRRATDGKLVLVPHLAYLQPEWAVSCPMMFSPRAGAVTDFAALGEFSRR
ncbi:tRNA lysidine(34) synthetase TilS [Roseococcus sp. YIM B11640]|uniref:tRNA lysidine(34) synthetase TilS n=1 Tax=Roseococcus sp. YIM B11640 TaxID=3133973 RepID=UPI003C7C35A2